MSNFSIKLWVTLLVNQVYVCVRYFKIISAIILAFFVILLNQAMAQVQFENTTSSAGGPYHTGESWGASWGHLDEDVYPDLFVSNHAMRSSLLRNNGNGTFVERLDIADLEEIMSSDPTADTHGGAWGDFDNDGDQDLFVARSSEGSRFYLFENNGQGFFEEKGGFYGIGGNGSGRMPILFDYTNDGRLDVVYAKAGGESKIFKWLTTSFTEDTTNVGLTGLCNGAASGFASDLFDTGFLDFICLSEIMFPYAALDTNTIPFADISSSIDPIGTNSDSVLADFNNDLKLDVFTLRGLVRPSGVTKVSDQRIEAWINVSGPYGTTVEKTVKFAATGPITVSVYARQVGQADAVFIGTTAYSPTSLPVTLDPTDPNNWGVVSPSPNEHAVIIGYDDSAQEWSVSLSNGGNGGYEGAYFVIDGDAFSTPTISNTTAIDGPLQPTFLLNDGTSLVDSSNRGIGAIMCGGIAAADFDNDMDVDLYMTCRTSLENIENKLYLNDGSGTFSLATVSGAEGLLGAGIDSGAGTAEMAITADYDVDGFMDLFVTNGNRLFPHFVKDDLTAGGPDQLYRNLGGNGNHWLQIDLEGVASNRDGFGAKVIVTAGTVSQLREQNGQYHRWSHDHKRLHYGLASNTTADVSIEWPDGTTDVHTAIAADRLYRAVQGGSMVDITPDASLPVMTIDSQSVNEGDSATLTVSLSAPSSLPISVDYQTVAITATENDDFISVSGSLTFAPNETSKTLSVSTVASTDLEPDESFVVSLYNSSGVIITESAGIVTIQEVGGQACGEPSYSPSSEAGMFIWQDCGATDLWYVRAAAGGSSSLIYYQGALTASNPITSVQTFSFEGLDSYALTNSDKNLDFSMSMAGAGQDGLDFALQLGSELCLSLDDPNQVIYVGVNKTPVASPVNLLNLTNICAAGLPTLSVADVSVSEAGGSADITVTMSSVSADIVSVTYASADGSATDGFDYISVSATVDIQPNDTTAVITIPILQDNDLESLEDFTLTLSNSVNADILDGDATVSIIDDELTACGQPSYSSSTEAGVFVWQDCGVTDLWYLRASAGGSASLIYYQGALTSNNPFTSVQTFSFEGNDSYALTNSDKNVDFDVSMANAGQDGLDFALVLGSDLCLSLDDPNQVIYVGVDKTPFLSNVNLLNLTNVCNAGLPTLSVSDVSVSEADGSADITVTLSNVSADVVSVAYASADGTATDGFDYTSVSGTVDIQPNDTTAMITIPILQDSDVESLEDFTVNLSNSVNADILNASATVSISDDELTACGQPSYSSSTEAGVFVWQDCGASDLWYVRATAGGGGLTYYQGALTSNNSFTSVQTFSFEGLDSFALTNSDKNLEFDMSMANAGQDGLDFALVLGSDLCLSLDDPNQVIYVGVDKTPFLSTVNLLNLTNVCNAGLPTLSVADVSVSEADGTAGITITMSNVSTDIVSVAYASANGSATDGLDYTSVSGTVDFQPNDTTGVITIPILQDGAIESLENFTLTLSNSVNADILDGTAVVSISDDEQTACGEPTYSSSVDAGIFVWQDCGGTEQWYIRGLAGGGSAISYTGTVISDSPITMLTTFSFEGTDSYLLSNSNQDLSFEMRMSSVWVDGLQFSLQPGSSCFDVTLPLNTTLVVGENNTIITPPFNVFTLGGC